MCANEYYSCVLISLVHLSTPWSRPRDLGHWLQLCFQTRHQSLLEYQCKILQNWVRCSWSSLRCGHNCNKTMAGCFKCGVGRKHMESILKNTKSSSSKMNSTASRASCTCLGPRGMLATLANMLHACWSSSCWHLCVQCVSCLETDQACYWRNAIENFDWESKSCCLSLSVDLCPELSAMELFVESLRKLP